MKKIFLTAVLGLFTMGSGFAQDHENLPEEAKEFLNDFFSDFEVEKMEKEDGRISVDKSDMYVVQLNNGMVLDFDENGEIVEIKGNGERIPEDALPSNVYDYIKENYSSTFIMGWEKDEDEQEVELANGTELEFDSEGNFLEEDGSWF